MKNIHILPTDKPSRLIKDIWKKTFSLVENFNTNHTDFKAHHIYITSDEKFNRDEYVTDGVEVIKATPKLVDAQGLVDRRDWKKIILTTDGDLIKDGVQDIDDEFLEWFVKNPSCEEIEVDYGFFTPSGRQVDPMGILQNHSKCVWKYKIIIPKEETLEEDLMMEVPMAQYPKILKHEFKVVTTEDIVGKRLEKYSERFDNDKSPIGNPETWGKRLVDETIEEAFDRINNSIDFTEFDFASFKLGIKHQQEKMCSHDYILTSENGHRIIKCQKCENIQSI